MNKYFKYIVIFLSALAIRLLPFRAPNLEPLMAVQMPFSRKFGWLASFLFGSLSIVIYDILTFRVGIWTLITAVLYGALGIGAYMYFKNHSGTKSYISYAIFGTILYDALTGLTIGPIFFGQSFTVSLIGQIPFTIIHLLGNVSFAILLSPLIERWLVKEKVAERRANIIRTVEV